MATLLVGARGPIALRSTALCLARCSRRGPARLALRPLSTSTPAPASAAEPRHTLAIVGGGLSGLSSAFYFLRALSPEVRRSTRVVVLEKQERIGGWCNTINVKVEEKETAVTSEGPPKELAFETGVRSIRPVGLMGWLTIEMAHTIGLTPSILTVPKTAPSAKNRFIYAPPTPGLTKLPSSLPSAVKAAFTTPLIRSIVPGILLEPFRPRSPLHSAHTGGDESVDSFFSRRFGKNLAERMLSAMIHGIYAGDTRRLSMRAVFPGLWEAEREWGSVIMAALFGGLWRRRGWAPKSPYRLNVEREAELEQGIKTRIAEAGAEGQELVESMQSASVWGVRGGLARLTEQLKSYLEQQGVEVMTGTEATVSRKGNQWTVSTPTLTLHPTHIITTNTAVLPADLLPPPIPHATVSVMNLAFPRPPASSPPLFPPGFGYLIPRSVSSADNPHNVLGVIFDSDVMPGVDDSAGLVKITIILGGPYWLDRNPLPDLSHEELVKASMATLRQHLPETAFPSPAYAYTTTQRNCIPHVPVGYFEEVRNLGRRLRAVEGVRVAVVGGGIASVGANGAVKAAYEVGESFAMNVMDGTRARTGTESWE